MRLYFFVVLALLTVCSAQSESDKPFSRVGVAVKASLLGAGVEAATSFTPRSNLRAGFNMFSDDRGFHKEGVSYGRPTAPPLHRSSLRFFPFKGSFHLSPGVLVYNGNQITANASRPGGNTFTLNNTTYTSDPSDPINGTGKVDFVKASPCSP